MSKTSRTTWNKYPGSNIIKSDNGHWKILDNGAYYLYGLVNNQWDMIGMFTRKSEAKRTAQQLEQATPHLSGRPFAP